MYIYIYNLFLLSKYIIITYSQDFIYPDNVGFPIGGPDSNQYAVIELHYNNPEEASGVCVCVCVCV